MTKVRSTGVATLQIAQQGRNSAPITIALPTAGAKIKKDERTTYLQTSKEHPLSVPPRVNGHAAMT
jgi:hypothetical protein